MVAIQELDAKNWEQALAAPTVLLILGKTTCQACKEWAAELDDWQSTFDIEFTKVLLDKPGLGRFKIAHPWVSEVDMLPMNVLIKDGEIVKQWAGAGIQRMENRIKRVIG